MKMESLKRTLFDKLGVNQKALEHREAARTILPGIPVIARLDGRAFHTYTKGLLRPFDPRLQQCMQATMIHVADAFDCDFAYTQSDEITLVWLNGDEDAQFVHGGKFQKLVSLTAAAASVKFAMEAQKLLPFKSNMLPSFDARVWQVPSFNTVVENLFWRQDDATRNSITMAAQAVYSHKELHGKGQRDMLHMLEAKGIVWGEYNPHFKRGIFAKRFKYEKCLPAGLLASIPEKHRPTGPVERSEYMLMDMGVLRERSLGELGILRSKGVHMDIRNQYEFLKVYPDGIQQ